MYDPRPGSRQIVNRGGGHQGFKPLAIHEKVVSKETTPPFRPLQGSVFRGSQGFQSLAGAAAPAPLTAVRIALTGVPAAVTVVRVTLTGVPAAVTVVRVTLTGVPAAVTVVRVTLTGVPAAVTVVRVALTGVPVVVTVVRVALTGVPAAVTVVRVTLTVVPAVVTVVRVTLTGVTAVVTVVRVTLTGVTVAVTVVRVALTGVPVAVTVVRRPALLPRLVPGRPLRLPGAGSLAHRCFGRLEAMGKAERAATSLPRVENPGGAPRAQMRGASGQRVAVAGGRPVEPGVSIHFPHFQSLTRSGAKGILAGRPAQRAGRP